VSGMEADPRSPGAKTLRKPCGEGLSVSRCYRGSRTRLHSSHNGPGGEGRDLTGCDRRNRPSGLHEDDVVALFAILQTMICAFCGMLPFS